MLCRVALSRQSNVRSNPEVVGSIPTEVKRFFLYLVWLPDSFTRANAQWVIHGFISTLIYTSELILCFTICVLSATRHNIHMYVFNICQVFKRAATSQ